MEIDEIRAIVELMDKHNLSEFKVEADDMHLCLKREIGVNTVVQQAATMSSIPGAINGVPAFAAPVYAEAAPAEKVAEVKNEAPKVTIDSPIVGTFYRSASPDSEVFVKIGDRVEADSVVGIIEAMKVMNEIKAEKSGVIKEVLLENAQSVEYGTPLFVLE
jgi:acetyl-CoA carboxylase biotin carboxyl carrier protein